MGAAGNVLRGLGVALGLVVAAFWLLLAIAVPIDELGECCNSTADVILLIGFGVWGIAGAYWTILICIRTIDVIRGRPRLIRAGRHVAVVALIAFVWLIGLFGVGASDW
jgi:uncharacterized membrane protein YidH (DUF202 family)